MPYSKRHFNQSSVATSIQDGKVTYHATTVFELINGSSGDAAILRNGGYITMTTCVRINQSCDMFGFPFTAGRNHGKMEVYCYQTGETVPFIEGMVITKEGHTYTPDQFAAATQSTPNA